MDATAACVLSKRKGRLHVYCDDHSDADLQTIKSEKGYRTFLDSSMPTVGCGNVGIGILEMWHGSSDTCIWGGEGGALLVIGDEKEDRDTSSVRSDGDSTLLEAKVEAHYPQVFGLGLASCLCSLNTTSTLN